MREFSQVLFRQKYRIAGATVAVFAFLAAWITSQRLTYRAEAKLLVTDAQQAAEREFRIHYAAETLASHRSLQAALGDRPNPARQPAEAARYDAELAALARRFRVEAKVHSPVLIASLEADAPAAALERLQRIVAGFQESSRRAFAERLHAREREVEDSRKRLLELHSKRRSRYEQLGIVDPTCPNSERDKALQRLVLLENEAALVSVRLAGAEATEAAARESGLRVPRVDDKVGDALSTASLSAQKAALERHIAALQETLRRIAGADSERADFEREIAAAEERFQTAVRGRDAAHVASSLGGESEERIQILQDAVLATGPAGSGAQFALAALAALCAGMVVGLLCEVLDPTIRLPEQLEERLKLPMLASAPPMSRNQSLLLRAAAHE